MVLSTSFSTPGGNYHEKIKTLLTITKEPDGQTKIEYPCLAPLESDSVESLISNLTQITLSLSDLKKHAEDPNIKKKIRPHINYFLCHLTNIHQYLCIQDSTNRKFKAMLGLFNQFVKNNSHETTIKKWWDRRSKEMQSINVLPASKVQSSDSLPSIKDSGMHSSYLKSTVIMPIEEMIIHQHPCLDALDIENSTWNKVSLTVIQIMQDIKDFKKSQAHVININLAVEKELMRIQYVYLAFQDLLQNQPYLFTGTNSLMNKICKNYHDIQEKWEQFLKDFETPLSSGITPSP